MAEYLPMSREKLLARGSCCDMGCVNCPYRDPAVFRHLEISSWIEEMLRSGETAIYYSSRMSSVPQVTLQNLTIVYQSYVKPVPEGKNN